MSHAALLLAGLILLGAVAYAVAFRASDNWIWNSLSLVSAAVGVAAVGLALMIFRVQDQMQRDEANDQAIVFLRLERLALQAATNSSDAKDLFQQQMAPAKQAASSQEVSIVQAWVCQINGVTGSWLDTPS